MQMRRRIQIPGMTLAVMLTLVVAQGLVFSPEAQAGDGGKLEGTWLIKTTRVHCDTREPLSAPFPSVHTYLRGGTVLDIGASPPAVLGGTRSAAHGIWERTGPGTFRERFHSFSFDADGVHLLTAEVVFTRSLIQGEHAQTDEIIGIGTGQFFTPAGALVVEACAEDRGQRFTFEEEE